MGICAAIWEFIKEICIYSKDSFKYIRNECIFLYQRIRYGFAEPDLWCLGDSIAKYIHPRIKAYRLHMLLQQSYPSLPDLKSFDDWYRIIKSIETAMEYIINEDKKGNMTRQERDSYYLTIQIGMNNFAKYCYHLHL